MVKNNMGMISMFRSLCDGGFTTWGFDNRSAGTLTVPMHDFTALRLQLGIPLDKDILGYIAEQPAETAHKLHTAVDEWEVR
jgi:hypothetical protein